MAVLAFANIFTANIEKEILRQRTYTATAEKIHRWRVFTVEHNKRWSGWLY